MAAELAEAMRLSPKEFIKGKMHLPAYRALYLDRLLEENEEVYSSRDKNFRDLVKGFKTIKDSDFKEPESLSGRDARVPEERVSMDADTGKLEFRRNFGG